MKKLYNVYSDPLNVKADWRRGENALRGLGFSGWVDTTTGLRGTWEPVPMRKAENRQTTAFRAAAFESSSGTVYETGPFHDVEALPPGTEITQEGFVDHDGRFFSREAAAEVLQMDHPPQSEEILKKSEDPEYGPVVNMPLSQITVNRDSLAGAFNNIERGKPSQTTGPLHVWQMEDGKHVLVDGHHRLASTLLHGGHGGHVPVQVIGHGYTDYWTTPTNPLRWTNHRFGGLETLFHPSILNNQLKKSGKLNKSINRFSAGLNKYLRRFNKSEINADDISTRLRDHQETLEAMATPGGQHPAFAIAARMAGHPADAELRRQAELEHGDDVVAVALAAHGLNPHDESLRMSIEAAIQGLRLAKNDFNVAVLPRVVMPAQEGAEHMASVIRQAYAANLVYEVRLGGKHSAGTACAYDRQADRFWLLKPGSGRVSPAKGVNETPYSQSRREAAFAQAARSYEALRDYYPECWLLTVDGHETACMEVMGPGYRPAQKYGDAADLLKPYQDSLDIFRWACLDWVLGNPDCHGGNVLVTEDGRVALIDHGSALAGNSFNPAADPDKSFIPYYLRVNQEIDWKAATADQKYRIFPHPTPEERETINTWMRGLGSSWEHVVEALAPQALPACKQRLQALLSTEDPADALLRAWAGLPLEGK